MARRNANLAGLAALGALGYALSKGKDGKNMAPVEDRGTYLDKALSDTDAATGQGKYRAEADTSDLEIEKNVGLGSPKAASAPKAATRSAAPKKAESKPSSTSSRQMDSRAGGVGMDKYIPRGTASQVQAMKESAYSRAQERAASPQGQAERKAQEEGQAVENMTGDFLPVGRLGKTVGTAAKSAKNALATRASEITPVEFLGASGRTAVNKADQLGYEAAKRIGYEEGKKIGQATSPRQISGPARQISGPRSEAVLNEADWTGGAVGYKRGGKVSAKAAKPAAKGWGQARGARGAKYY